MSEEENKVDLEEILDEQLKKLTVLKDSTLLLQCKREIKDELQELQTVVSTVSSDIENMRKVLATIKEQNTRLKEFSLLLETLDKKIIYKTQNVPPELIQQYQNASTKRNVYNGISPDILECSIDATQSTQLSKIPGSSNNRLKNIEIQSCKRVLSYEPDVCPTIPFIITEEFNKIPKYIIGRQTLETINGLISGINQTLIAKYTILSLGKAAAQKKGEINLYLHYKKQELDLKGENGYLYFFTAEDYNRQTKTKLDKTKLNLITALRHCKRLREYRMQNELRYIITP